MFLPILKKIHAAKSLRSCPTLCDPIDSSPPGSAIPGILQARTLEWVAISFSNAWQWKVKVKSLSHARPSATPWTAAFQAPPSMGFSRQEYWSGLPLQIKIEKLKKISNEMVVNQCVLKVPCILWKISIFSKLLQNLARRVAEFAVFQISLMSDLTGNSWIFVFFYIHIVVICCFG